MEWDDCKVLIKLFSPLVGAVICMALFAWLLVEIKDSVTLCWYSDIECLDRIGYGNVKNDL